MRGSCLCGAVGFIVTGTVPDAGACHCGMCRRWHGAPFVFTPVPSGAIELVGGANVCWFRSSSSAERGFCRLCGSKLFWRSVDGDSIDITMGAFTDSTGRKLVRHIYVASKGDYYDLPGDLPQFAASARGAQPQPAAARLPASASQPDIHTGRCLCGAIHMDIRGGMRDVMVCHCRQCRQWHGHAPGYTKARWADIGLVGKENLEWFVSSATARRGYCGRCGSSLFWERAGADAVSIPAGILDAPTGLRERVHIFVADKGDYYSIADGLPQYPQSGGNALPF